MELTYGKSLRVAGGVIGLNDDFDLTLPLANFLHLNEALIVRRLGDIEKTLVSYRHHHEKECRWKSRVLTYRFLYRVYDRPQDPATLASSCIDPEHDLRVRQLLTGSEPVFQAAYERFATVSSSETATWWYIFWVSQS